MVLQHTYWVWEICTDFFLSIVFGILHLINTPMYTQAMPHLNQLLLKWTDSYFDEIAFSMLSMIEKCGF